MAHLTDLDHTAPADSLKSGAQVLNAWRTRIDALNDILGDITTAEANQVENLGSVTVSNTQWGYLGELNQSLITTASPTFNGLTLTSLTLNAAFTLGGTLTLGGTVAGGDYAWTNVGDMTFANGSILASGSSASDTLILKANDTTCITLTTGSTDKVEIVALNALTAIANLDIGAYTFTCAGLIDDSLTSGRVVFVTTGGLLADDGDFLFATDTLTVTKLGAFQAVGAIDFNSQNMTNVDIDSGTVGGVTLDGAIAGGDQTFSNVGNMTFAAGSILASGNTNTNTLLLKANDTTCITLTTAATDQMDLAAVYSLTAINNLDIGSYTFTCAGLIDDSLTSGRVVFVTTGGLLADDADMTFSTDTLTVKKIVLNDATTATTDMLTLTPSGAVATTAIWKGIYIDGDALDPSGTNAAIEGVYVDLSGVASATGLEMRGVYASVPAGLGYEALHIIGKIKLDNDESTLASGETATGIDIIVSASAASGGKYHAIDVATTGTSSATLAALGTHTGIDVIHQHTGSFIAPTQAWTYDDSGSSYGEVTTAFGSAGTDVTIFPDDDDAIFIGANAAFDEIEVILATKANVDIKPTFWYSTAVTFIQFFPADDTEGFTQDGDIRFNSDDLTNFAALSVNSVSKFYIKIIRTKNNVGTDPIEDTIKTLAVTECFWNSTGAMQVVSIAVPTITTVTTFTASGNLDIGAYDFRAATLTADGLTAARVVFAGASGVLSDDGDFTFSVDTLTVTKIGAFEATGAINFASQNMTNVDIDSGTIDGISALTSSGNLDIGAYNFRAATLTADGLASGRVVFTTTNGQLVDNANFTLSTNTLALGASGTLDVSSGTLTLTNDQISGDKVQGGTIGSTTISALTTAGITATSNLDIGAYTFRCNGLIDDSLTSGRVVITTTNGQLADDAGFTFSANTLGVVNVTASGTVTTAAFIATGNLDIGAYTFRCNGLIDDSLTSGRVIFSTTNGQLADDQDFTFSVATLTVTNIAAFTLSGKLTAGASEIEGSVFDINGGAIDGTIIGANSAAAGTFVALTATGAISFDGGAFTFNTSEADLDVRFAASSITNAFYIDGATGKVFINDNANASALGPSLTIDGAGNDGDYFACQDSTQIAHGMTTRAETDTFFMFTKAVQTQGGVQFKAFTEGDYAITFRAAVTSETNARNTAAEGAIQLWGELKSGTTTAAMSADKNLLVIRSLTTTRFVFDSDGEMHSDAIIGVGDDWDEWDDLALASDLSRLPGAKFNEMMKYRAEDFEKAGLLTLSVDEDGVQHAFIRNKAMHQFSMCCFADIHDRLTRYEKAFDKLGISKKELLALGV